jgi:hypothetical protein
MVIPVRPGSIVALVTPMTASNAIDYVKLESLLKWHIAEGFEQSNYVSTDRNSLSAQSFIALYHFLFINV